MTELRILFEDEDLIAVSKPVGLVVDAGDERIIDGIEDLISVMNRAGKKVFPYHRLDRDTSGIVLLGKSRRISKEITKLFEEKRIRKSYLAVVAGAWPKALNKVELELHGKQAVTTFRVLSSGDDRSWLEALPKTGRKHQIRLHCAQSGHPILGDAVYGAAIGENGHALHAYKLQFKDPRTREDRLVLDPPQAWRDSWLKGLEFDRSWTQLFPLEKSRTLSESTELKKERQ